MAFDTAKSILGSDGVRYCQRAVMPAAEGDLFNDQGQDPFAIPYQEAISAKITFEVQGAVQTNATYVVMQTDFGDGLWYDVAWCNFSGLAQLNFNLTAGVDAVNASTQQTRPVGTAPTPTLGANTVMLGGRIRFVGKATITTPGASSSAVAASPSSAGPGVLTPGVLVTIRYKGLGLR